MEEIERMVEVLNKQSFAGKWEYECAPHCCGWTRVTFCYEVTVDEKDLPTVRQCYSMGVREPASDLDYYIDSIQRTVGYHIGRALVGLE